MTSPEPQRCLRFHPGDRPVSAPHTSAPATCGQRSRHGYVTPRNKSHRRGCITSHRGPPATKYSSATALAVMDAQQTRCWWRRENSEKSAAPWACLKRIITVCRNGWPSSFRLGWPAPPTGASQSGVDTGRPGMLIYVPGCAATPPNTTATGSVAPGPPCATMEHQGVNSKAPRCAVPAPRLVHGACRDYQRR